MMVGKKLSHYDITAELGRGGMGIVYKAKDNKLDRTVAIKILPASALANGDDRARFYREAKAAAQLHHPNIASIFEIDEAVPEGGSTEEPRPFIAMEFIDGEQLDARVKAGPFSLTDAVRVASQMASALEAAHEKDIVHRDIKSANVMFTKKGDAKVLDFGLAQTAQSTKLTQMGSTLGTIAYMSPEQARGEAVDQRTDLWSLGVVLYEMIAGRMPFAADYEQAAVYGILNEDPEPLTALRTGVPMGLEWIVTKLLAKKASDRYQNASDLLVDLRTVDLKSSGLSRSATSLAVTMATSATMPATPGPVGPVSSRGFPGPVWAGLGAALVGLAWLLQGMISTSERSAASEISPKRLSFPVDVRGSVVSVDISPSGDEIVVAADFVNIYNLKTGAVKQFTPSDAIVFADYSPDGKSLLLTSSVGISRMSLENGSDIPVLTTQEGGPRATWIDSDQFLFEELQGIYRGSITTGDSSRVTVPDSSIGEYDQDYPQILPDGNTVMATAEFRDQPSRIGFWDLESGKNLSYIDVPGYRAQLIGENHLVFEMKGDIMAIRFDRESLSQTGPLVLVARGARADGLSTALDGTLVHAGADLGIRISGPVQPTIVQRIGSSVNVSEIADLPPDRYRDAAISPDGKEAAVVVKSVSGNNVLSQIWIIDIGRGTRRVLNAGAGNDFPAWTADGDSIVFILDGRNDEIWIKAASGRGAEHRFVETSVPELADLTVSSDGTMIAAVGGFDGQIDTQSAYLALLLPTGPVQLHQASEDIVNIRHPSFSLDGKYVAFDASGRILVLALDDLDGTPFVAWETGMSRPKWAPDGSRLFALGPDGNIQSIPIQTDPLFAVTGSQRLEVNYGIEGSGLFDIFPDGKRFLMALPATNTDATADSLVSISKHDLYLIVNLPALLE